MVEQRSPKSMTRVRFLALLPKLLRRAVEDKPAPRDVRTDSELITAAYATTGWDDFIVTEDELNKYEYLRQAWMYPPILIDECGSYFFFMGKKSRVHWKTQHNYWMDKPKGCVGSNPTPSANLKRSIWTKTENGSWLRS